MQTTNEAIMRCGLTEKKNWIYVKQCLLIFIVILLKSINLKEQYSRIPYIYSNIVLPKLSIIYHPGKFIPLFKKKNFFPRWICNAFL